MANPAVNPAIYSNGKLMAGVDAVLLDIEGTTSSISFVKEELFPYARREMADHLRNTWSSPATQAVVLNLREQLEEDRSKGVEVVTAIPEGDEESVVREAVLANLLGFMDRDRKVTPLKTLQGSIWKKGYAEGVINGHVYDDVVVALKSWTKANLEVFIYSSGSVEAQKLIFGHTLFGDLLPYFRGHFDTTTGGKQETNSYKKIAVAIGHKPPKILFVTDVVGEARAAREAGMKVVLSVREGTVPLSDEDKRDYDVIYSFDALLLEAPGMQMKRDRGRHDIEKPDVKKHKK